jgi:hypothetical protein
MVARMVIAPPASQTQRAAVPQAPEHKLEAKRRFRAVSDDGYLNIRKGPGPSTMSSRRCVQATQERGLWKGVSLAGIQKQLRVRVAIEEKLLFGRGRRYRAAGSGLLAARDPRRHASVKRTTKETGFHVGAADQADIPRAADRRSVSRAGRVAMSVAVVEAGHLPRSSAAKKTP